MSEPPSDARGRVALADLAAGGIFAGFGLGFAAIAATYDVGTPLRMGPGFFPLMLGGLLVLLGLGIVAKGFLSGDPASSAPVPWRALALIVGAILFFGLTIRGLGFVPAVFVTGFVATFASRRTTLLSAGSIAAGLTVLCVLIFVLALGLRIPLLGPWLAL